MKEDAETAERQRLLQNFPAPPFPRRLQVHLLLQSSQILEFHQLNTERDNTHLAILGDFLGWLSDPFKG